MSDILRKAPLTESMLQFVADFDCGSEEWEVPLARWIKAGQDVKYGALAEMARARKKGKPLDVWLYSNQDGNLVGYGALGSSNWEWPTTVDSRVPVSIITNVAIQKDFQGKPDEPPKYSTQIMEDLIHEAQLHAERQPLLGLYVDPRNEKAIKFYRRMGFLPFHKRFGEDGVEYESWLLKLQQNL